MPILPAHAQSRQRVNSRQLMQNRRPSELAHKAANQCSEGREYTAPCVMHGASVPVQAVHASSCSRAAVCLAHKHVAATTCWSSYSVSCTGTKTSGDVAAAQRDAHIRLALQVWGLGCRAMFELDVMANSPAPHFCMPHSCSIACSHNMQRCCGRADSSLWRGHLMPAAR